LQKLDYAECGNAFELSPPHLKSFFGEKAGYHEDQIKKEKRFHLSEWRFIKVL